MKIQTANAIIKLAKKHATKNDTAFICYTQSLDFLNEKRILQAGRRALDSLANSVGMYHPDYREAINL